MTAANRTTVVGVFDDPIKAREAVAELRQAGFRDDQIGVVSHGRDDDEGSTEVDKGDAVAEGALAGVAAGAGVGALWGLGIMAGLLPAIGPVIAGGTLAAILASAATGAAAAGLVGALIGMGIPKEEAKYYDEQFRAGRTIITVQGDQQAAQARMILDRFSGHDFRSRGQAAGHQTVDIPVNRQDMAGAREAVGGMGTPACEKPNEN